MKILGEPEEYVMAGLPTITPCVGDLSDHTDIGQEGLIHVKPGKTA